MTTIAEALDQAQQAFQAGAYQQAGSLCLQILQADARQAGALALLGNIYLAGGQLAEAIHCYQRALQLRPNDADSHNSLGVALARQGRPAEALPHFHQVLLLTPDSPAAHNNLGLVLKDHGQLAEAEASFRQALRLNPHFAEAHSNLGLALKEQGRLEEALASLREALRLKPTVPEIHNNLGLVLKDQDRPEEAEACYRQALRLRPSYADAWSNLGYVLEEQDKLDEAVASLRQALRINPQHAEAHCHLGMALKEQGQWAEALASLRQAFRLKPDAPEVQNNLGLLLQEQGQLEEALTHYQQALQRRPDNAQVHLNMGLVLQALGRLPEAQASLVQARVLEPGLAEAHRSLAFLALLQGDFERGWAEYEWRWLVKEGRRAQRHFRQPLWDGSALEGRTVLLYAEQGLGDTLQFCRYAPRVKAQGGVVLLECPSPLVRLLHTLAGVDQVLTYGEALPPFDVQAPLLSLPRLLGTTSVERIPAQVPYLAADAEREQRWRTRLSALPGLRVGIAWQGNPAHKNDRQRSVPCSRFAPLAALPGVSLVSLQQGSGREQLQQHPGLALDLGSEVSDLADTAAVLRCLDLVVSVDSAVAHLAGALAVPAWVVLPFAPDWRWLRQREDSPWYPSLRLFRQQRPGDWDGVFARLAGELAQWTRRPR